MTTHSGRSRRHRQAGVVVVVVVAGQRWWWWGEGGASGVARWGHGGDPHGVLEPCRNGVVCLEAAPIVLLDVRLKGGICVVPVRRERQRVAGAHPPLQGAERQQKNGMTRPRHAQPVALSGHTQALGERSKNAEMMMLDLLQHSVQTCRASKPGGSERWGVRWRHTMAAATFLPGSRPGGSAGNAIVFVKKSWVADDTS